MDTDTTEFSALLTLGHIAIWRACHHGFPCSFHLSGFFLLGMSVLLHIMYCVGEGVRQGGSREEYSFIYRLLVS